MAILGIDEVGRGPLAGPLVVGAVILPEEEKEWFSDLKDSKKLTVKKREELSRIISKEAAVGLGWVYRDEIDRLGISEALKLATKRAVKSVQRLHTPFSQIIIDGKVNFLKGTALEKYVTTLIKADDLIKEVSAASIVAKVARDDYMVKIAKKYPSYGFEKHVGYGTKKHLQTINDLGVCPEHRLSFEPCKSLVGFLKEEKPKKNTTKIGLKGEDVVEAYLKKLGHEILVRNFKTYYYEIDIVSVFQNKIYFTEVKYRKNNEHGSGLEVITAEAKKRLAYKAECFLKYKREYGKFDPLLAVAEVYGDNFELKEWLVLDE